MNALERLAQWISSTELDPGQANLDRAINSVIDTLACNLAGIGEPATAAVFKSIRDSSSGEVTAFGFGQSSTANAALVNATAAHSLDFDDYNRSTVAHTSTVLIPASLAVAEQYRCSGYQCLEASIIGLEVMAYLGAVINMDHYLKGWHATATLGSVGAAAVSSRLMGLNAMQTAASLSLATSMIGGFKLQFGTMAKALHAGLAAQAGINAAIMASNGITASTEVFDGNPGITSMWSNASTVEFSESILPEDGKLAIEREGFHVKCYPSCGYTSRAIDGMIGLCEENKIEAADIRIIEIDVPDRHAQVASFLAPQNTMQARFSFPYCLAVAALFREARVEHFSDQLLADELLQNLISRVVVRPYKTDPELEDLSPEAPDQIRISLSNGQQLEKTILNSRGSPLHPLSRNDLFKKFWDCVGQPVDTEIQHLAETEFSQLASNHSVAPLINRVKQFCSQPNPIKYHPAV